MSKTVIATCGTSILSSSCWNLKNIKRPEGEPNDLMKKKFEHDNNMVIEKFLEGKEVRDLVKTFDLNCWTEMNSAKFMSAELASLKFYLETDREGGRGDESGRDRTPFGSESEDKLVFLHSGNKEGRRCANIIEEVIGLLKVQKLMPDVPVVLHGFDGLDPVDGTAFGNSLEQIWKFCNDILEEEIQLKNEIVFNLTGGYKAISMVLAGLCANFTTNLIKIVYLHETAAWKNLFIMNFGGEEECDLQTGWQDPISGESGGLSL